MKNSKQKQLIAAIGVMPPGSVISIADFIDIAEPKTISKMLTRLSEDGCIEKVMRSLFWKPDESGKGPNPHEVAKALARENNWALAPSGYTALHIMGVENEEPEVWTFVTSGTYRKYSYGDINISFTHTNWRLFSAMSEKTKLLVQCLKAYGKEHLSEERLRTMLSFCSGWEWKNVLRETKSATAWVARVVMRMIALTGVEI